MRRASIAAAAALAVVVSLAGCGSRDPEDVARSAYLTLVRTAFPDASAADANELGRGLCDQIAAEGEDSATWTLVNMGFEVETALSLPALVQTIYCPEQLRGVIVEE